MDFPARWRETATRVGGKGGENASHHLDISPVTTLLISHPACLAHDMGEGHPERPDRLRAVERAFESEVFQMLARDVAPRADFSAIARVHPQDYIEAIRAATPKQGLTVIDQDTSMSPGTFEAALRSAGGAVFAVDEVMSRKVRNAFVATRPPGHHAELANPHGLLLLQQRSRRRPPRPGGPRRRAGRDRRFRRSSRQRHAAHLLGRPERHVRVRPMRCLFIPAPARSASGANTTRSSTRRCGRATRATPSVRRWRS